MSNTTKIAEHLRLARRALLDGKKGQAVSGLRAVRELLSPVLQQGRELRESCALCSEMKPQYSAFSCRDKHVPLPEEARHLIEGVDLTGGGGRSFQVVPCPTCGLRWSVETDYEFLANGSEDYVYVTRLDPDELIERMLDLVHRTARVKFGIPSEDWPQFEKNLKAALKE